jgi:hypothetical protein
LTLKLLWRARRFLVIGILAWKLNSRMLTVLARLLLAHLSHLLLVIVVYRLYLTLPLCLLLGSLCNQLSLESSLVLSTLGYHRCLCRKLLFFSIAHQFCQTSLFQHLCLNGRCAQDYRCCYWCYWWC